MIIYSKQNYLVIHVKIKPIIFVLFDIPIQVHFRFTSFPKKKKKHVFLINGLYLGWLHVSGPFCHFLGFICSMSHIVLLTIALTSQGPIATFLERERGGKNGLPSHMFCQHSKYCRNGRGTFGWPGEQAAINPRDVHFTGRKDGLLQTFPNYCHHLSSH